MNERLTQIERRRDDLIKQHKLDRLLNEIDNMKRITQANTEFRDSDSIINIEREIQSVLNRVYISVAFRKRTLKFDKITLYHDKSVKKHRDYVRNLTTTFRILSDEFFNDEFKIIFVMQFLIDEFKKT